MLCARTAAAHSLNAFRCGRNQGVSSVASELTSDDAPRTALCCHVCACAEPTASALPSHMLAALTAMRGAVTEAAERPTDLPPPPPPQTAAGWRGSRTRVRLQGGSDTPAVEPGEKVTPKKRKRATFADPEVEQPASDAAPAMEQPVTEPVDEQDASWAYPSQTDDDVAAYGSSVTTSLKGLWLGILRLMKYYNRCVEPCPSDWTQLVWCGLKTTSCTCLIMKRCALNALRVFTRIPTPDTTPDTTDTMRTKKKAEQLYYWPRLSKDIVKWVGSCDPCLRNKAVRQKPLGKLNPLQVPERRWESVSMDFVTDLLVTPRGNDSIWVVVDRLSKLTHLEPCKKTITAEGTAKMFERAVFRHHGIPTSIVSDRDVRFVSDFWRSINQRFGTQLYMSTRDHPQSDGQTENANQIMEDTLRHFVGPFQTDWEDLLPVVEFAMNNSRNSTIQNTPFMLTYAKHPDDPTTATLRHRNHAVCIKCMAAYKMGPSFC